MRRSVALVVALVASAFLTSCSRVDVTMPAAPLATAQLAVEDVWVRTTTGAEDTSMTAAYMTIENPGDADVRLTSVDCPDAGVVQVHEMVMHGGKMIMQETKEGIAVPAAGHANLTPGGFHIMLMMLNRKLVVGERVSLTLHFSDGGQLHVIAPVKAFVEQADRLREATPSATASS